jgi:hypothetical protein
LKAQSSNIKAQDKHQIPNHKTAAHYPDSRSSLLELWISGFPWALSFEI